MSTSPTTQDLMALPPEFLAEDIGFKLVNASIAFIVFNTVVYALFLTSRLFYAQRNGWDTWVIYPVAYLFTIVLAISCIYMVRIGGLGRHMAYWYKHDPATLTTYLKIQTACEFVYMVGITFPKISILLLYLSIFVSRPTRIVTWTVLGIVVTHWIVTGVIATFTICQPFAYKWDKTIPGGRCTNLMAAYKYVSIPNIATDLAILVLPASSLLKLQTSKARKVGIFITFLTGSLGIITSILRFVGFYKTDLQSDLTWLGIETMIYTLVEPSAYFICSCLPGTRPLLTAMVQKIRSTASTDKRNCHNRPLRLSGLKNPHYGHAASISAPQGRRKDYEDHEDGLIFLHETVKVDHESSVERAASNV